MGLLGIARLGAELAHRFTEVLLAVTGFNAGARRRDRLIGEMNRIRPHVGDETALVEALGTAHRFPGGETQLAVRLLLKGAGGEGRHGTPHRGLLINGLHPPVRTPHLVDQGSGLRL